MERITKIPVDVLQIIADKLCIKDDANIHDIFNFRGTCRHIRKVHVRRIPERYSSKLSNVDIINYPQLREIDVGMNPFITADIFPYIPQLLRLNCGYNIIRNKSLQNVPRLTHLCAPHNRELTDAALQYVPDLIELWPSPKMTDACLSYCPKLTRLELCTSSRITDSGLARVPNLTYLSTGNHISDIGISHVTNLRVLDLSDNTKITGIGLKKLAHLRELLLGFKTLIYDADLSFVPKLTMLETHPHISDVGIGHIPLLEKLVLYDSISVTGPAICKLKFLTHLVIQYDTGIIDDYLQIPTLRVLNIEDNHTIVGSGFKYLTRLRKLVLENCDVADMGLENLPHLKQLSIIGENINLSPTVLGLLRNLVELKLDSISNILLPSQFPTLEKLVVFDSPNVPVVQIGNPGYPQLKNTYYRNTYADWSGDE